MSYVPQGSGWWRKATAAALVALLAGCGSSTAAAPDPLDVSAAQACQDVTVWLGSKGADAAASDALMAAAEKLLAGSEEAALSSAPPPKYGDLGVAIDDALGAPDLATLSSAVDSITTQCGTIPAGAKAAGGYTK